MKLSTYFIASWLSVQFFLLGYVRQRIDNEVRARVYVCSDVHSAFAAGVLSVVAPVSLFVHDTPETVSYCAEQRANLLLKNERPQQ
jgi:hypothetical protein